MYVLLLALYGCLFLACGLLIFTLLRMTNAGFSEEDAGEAAPDAKDIENNKEEEYEENELL